MRELDTMPFAAVVKSAQNSYTVENSLDPLNSSNLLVIVGGTAEDIFSLT